jgi:uncharacterized protein
VGVRIGTSEYGGTFYSQGCALKTVLDRRPALAPVEVLESHTASIQNANRLNAGEIELGFMASNWIGRARRGEPPFTCAIDIRMAAPMNAGPLFFITRADSPVRSLADLRGRRIAVGPEKSGMVQHVHTIFGVLGIAFTEFVPVYLDFEAGAQALATGEIEVQFQCPIPNKVMTDLSERVDVRVLPYPPGELERVLDAVSFYRRTVMPKGALRGLDADVPQLAVVNILATHARVPELLVREAVATIASSAGELGRLNRLFVGLGELLAPLSHQGAKALEFGGVSLHPGAVAAYREAGLL